MFTCLLNEEEETMFCFLRKKMLFCLRCVPVFIDFVNTGRFNELFGIWCPAFRISAEFKLDIASHSNALQAICMQLTNDSDNVSD